VVQFRHPDFISMLERVIAETGVDPANVELEITESVAMLDPERIVALLNRIKEFGFTVAIDDFGTGFSSLSYLGSLPIDSLKIDRSFVMALHEKRQNVEIVRAVVMLAKALGRKVIAEGIETVDQLAMLRQLGVDEGQGYLLSRPLRAEQATELLTIAQAVDEASAQATA
jgi:EAL domain-containing protein (putative c-di-GMP-specific phosphodiesterase class I)